VTNPHPHTMDFAHIGIRWMQIVAGSVTALVQIIKWCSSHYVPVRNRDS